MREWTTPDAPGESLRARRDSRQVALGALAVLLLAPGGLAVLAGLAALSSGEAGAFTFLFGGLAIGLVQALWVVPLALWARATSRTAFLQGALIAAAVIFLLNAGCYGVLIACNMLVG